MKDGDGISCLLSHPCHKAVKEAAYTLGLSIDMAAFTSLEREPSNMKALVSLCTVSLLAYATQAPALSLAPEEFKASRELACVLAQQSLGQLSDDEYGAKAHTVLDGFDEAERDNILAQAVGYFGGLMFSSADDKTKDNSNNATLRLEGFIASSTCSSNDYRKVSISL